MKELSQEDYKTIIHHYGFLCRNPKINKKKENGFLESYVLVLKMAKKFKNDETPAIGICTYSILKNRNINLSHLLVRKNPK